MPPKTKITRDMIVDAAFQIIRSEGVDNINARSISARLGCSTQPVLYHFKKIEEIKKAAYQKADEFHSIYISDIKGENLMKEIGLRYIQFGLEEKNLFRFLFQSNEFSGKSVSEMTSAEELQPIIAILSQAAKVSTEHAKTIFRSLFLFAHGYSSIFANNELEYDEKTILYDFNLIFDGLIYALKGEF